MKHRIFELASGEALLVAVLDHGSVIEFCEPDAEGAMRSYQREMLDLGLEGECVEDHSGED